MQKSPKRICWKIVIYHVRLLFNYAPAAAASEAEAAASSGNLLIYASLARWWLKLLLCCLITIPQRGDPKKRWLLISRIRRKRAKTSQVEPICRFSLVGHWETKGKLKKKILLLGS